MASVQYWEKQVQLLTRNTIVTGSNLRTAEREARGSSPSAVRAKEQLPDFKRAHHQALSELDAAEQELKRAKAAANR